MNLDHLPAKNQMADLCFKNGERIVFIGDSITDCGRRDENAPLGDGYVRLFVDMATAYYPERKVDFINTGIGGNTVLELRNRWDVDAISHRPDWLSVKIGINDLHRCIRDGISDLSPEHYGEVYDEILAAANRQTDARFVLIEPFYISCDPPADSFEHQVLDILPRYLEVVSELSQKYNAKLVKTHEMFQRHLKYRPSSVFCPEPVHPNGTGHFLIAAELFKVLTSDKDV